MVIMAAFSPSGLTHISNSSIITTGRDQTTHLYLPPPGLLTLTLKPKFIIIWSSLGQPPNIPFNESFMETTGREPDESVSDLYARILLVKRIGFPLWFPEPSQYPPGYSRRGVSVGDVGVITFDGHFDFIFNIFNGSSPTRAVNGRAPPPYQSLEFNEPRDVRRTPHAHSTGGAVMSTYVKRELEPSGPHVSRRWQFRPSNITFILILIYC